MRPRIVLEVLVVMGIVGLLLEIADGGHTWIVISAGAAAAVWLLARAS